ncbi:Uncharacterized protein TPAR_04546 [Tolypocladium paradoxum]|uniref:Uncharacterized protein n=1 Tax=Tolypocladium paradoxum TaxID=94208 RepID=A0A2S4KYI5_9HYPO|nr:Uncharacterized protein TPAR_04546 [Tolypocladium paradoxum]
MTPEDAAPRPLAELIRGRKLRVSPLVWTSHHLELVGCRFEDDDAGEEAEHAGSNQNTTQRRENDGALSDEEWVEPCTVQHLAQCGAYRSKVCCISNLLWEDKVLVKACDHPKFFFAGRSVHRPKCTLFYDDIQPGRDVGQVPPRVLGYFVYSDAVWRTQQVTHARRHGVAVALLKEIPRKCKEWPRYPYILCLLLCIAQFRVRVLKSPKTTAHTSRLLVSHVSDIEFIHLFEAEVTSELLQMLDKPDLATGLTAWPTIKHQKIPFKPYEDFKERLMAKILTPSPFQHHEGTETRDETTTVLEHVGKRRREQEGAERHNMRRKV